MQLRLLPALISLAGPPACGDDNAGPCDGLQRVSTFAESQTRYPVAGLASDRDYVYWTEAQGATVYRRAKLGGTIEVLASDSGSAHDLVVDELSVYWLTGEGAIHAVDKATRVMREVLPGFPCVTQEDCYASLRGIDEVLVRWNSDNRAIEQIAKSDGSSTIIGYTSWGGIAVDAQYIYWTDVNAPQPFAAVSLRVMRVERQAGQPDVVAELGDALPVETKLDAGSVYVAALTRVDGIGQISGIASNGDALFFAEGDELTVTFAVDTGRVYYETNSTIVRASVAESTPEPLACVDDAPVVMVADEGLYWGAREVSRTDE
jgi:hypothetical protein